MQIPSKAQVICTDGHGGHSEYILMNPVLEQITHLVVRTDASPHTEYIVPIEIVSATTADTITLGCSKAALKKMDPFIEKRFIEEKIPQQVTPGVYSIGNYYYWPIVTGSKTVRVPVEDRQIPLDEIAVERGTRVMATDGPVGQVDEFLMNADGHITHLVLREGHLWGQKDVTIPISAMGKTSEEMVHLSLTKKQIEALPTVPIHRRWA